MQKTMHTNADVHVCYEELLTVWQIWCIIWRVHDKVLKKNVFYGKCKFHWFIDVASSVDFVEKGR